MATNIPPPSEVFPEIRPSIRDDDNKRVEALLQESELPAKPTRRRFVHRPVGKIHELMDTLFRGLHGKS